MNNILSKLGLSFENIAKTKRFIVSFYIIGALGMIIPYTFNFFKFLTPFALLLNFIILYKYHQGSKNKKTFLIFFLIFAFSFFIEALGVETSKVFGSFKYGNALGLKIFETPLIIGLNWLFLSYTTTSFFENIKTSNFLKILFASLLMLIYDIVLEQIAPKLDFWYWKDNIIPIQNYITWFILALIFTAVFKIFKIKTNNKLSKLIFICQFLFFCLIFIKYLFV